MRRVALVLLPGLDGTGELFAPLLPELPPWVRPVVVSYPRDVALGYAGLLPIAARALPARGPFAVLGESFSGPLAAMIAGSRPPGLAALILCASFVRRPFRVLPAAARVLVTGRGASLWPLLLRARAPFVPEPQRWLVRQALDVVETLDPAVVARRIREILRVDAEADLRRSDVPLLYLQALGDRLIRAHNADRVRRVRPDARLVRIDTLHFLLQLAPRPAAAAIAAFLGSALEKRGKGVSP